MVNSLLEIIHRVHLNPLAAKLSVDMAGIKSLGISREDVKKSIYKNIFSQYYNLISAIIPVFAGMTGRARG